MDVSLVIPAYNEAGNIGPLLGEIRDALDGQFDYEVIFVDDGSDDNTFAELINARTDMPRTLRVQRHPYRCGQSAAIFTGVRAARAHWIATLDADGQNDPADIEGMFTRLRRPNADARLQLVAGHRRIRSDGWLKRTSSRIANSVRRRLLGDDARDTGCGLKIFSRRTFLELPHFDHMHRFLPALVRRNGGIVEMYEVNHRPRRHGRTKYGVHNRLWVGIIDLLGVMWLQRRGKIPEWVEER
ncbi:MAG: glycosyltransferase family 2 protein [Gammaproteobacteria bacterium]